MSEAMKPEIRNLFFELGQFLAKHEKCIEDESTLEISLEFLYCENCKVYTNVKK